MKKIFVVLLVLFSFSEGFSKDLCGKYTQSNDIEILKSLAIKLSYTYEELCSHERILDIQKENREYYYAEEDRYEEHQVMTLHYNEYSCEYHFNKYRETWMSDRQYCYGTW